MDQTYYRYHWANSPQFCGKNAWSAPWGSTFSEDGSQTACGECDGAGAMPYGPCDSCGGEGWLDAVRGYSACWSSEDLMAYFAERGEPADTDGQVIVFTGQRVGNGFDGEPLVVPAEIIHLMTWSTFAQGQR
jgi:hypothetical protein